MEVKENWICDKQENKQHLRVLAAAPTLIEALKVFQKAWNENRLFTSDEAAKIRAAVTLINEVQA